MSVTGTADCGVRSTQKPQHLTTLRAHRLHQLKGESLMCVCGMLEVAAIGTATLLKE
jgi:hypothetical protein